MLRLPSVLVAYPGPCVNENIQDITLYLRPESNGVKVESTILKVIREAPYNGSFEMVYLANIPGDFIVENKIIEEHYALKLRFAREGKECFTETMARLFEQHFAVPFDEARILGACEAMKKLGLSAEELIGIWVPRKQMCEIHGQTIKKYQDFYLVNYDIPALLHKNSRNTDIFSMILRCTSSYGDIHAFVVDCSRALKEQGIISNSRLYSHVFHYSKSPFEQILDGIGYVYAEQDRHVDVAELSFFSYLISRGLGREEILEAIRRPIMLFRDAEGRVREENLFEFTYESSFPEACEKFQARV